MQASMVQESIWKMEAHRAGIWMREDNRECEHDRTIGILLKMVQLRRRRSRSR